MRQRRGELPDRRHPIDVAEILSKLLQLDFRHLAGQQIGKHFSDEVELSLQVVRRRAIVTDRAEHQPSHDSPPRFQRHRHLWLDAVREIALPIHRRLIRQLLEP